MFWIFAGFRWRFVATNGLITVIGSHPIDILPHTHKENR